VSANLIDHQGRRGDARSVAEAAYHAVDYEADGFIEGHSGTG
jgi:hypothetical protein